MPCSTGHRVSSIKRDVSELAVKFGVEFYNGLSKVVERLDHEVSRGALARYHAILQLIMAVKLHKMGFDVSVEEDLPSGFRADVYGEGPCCTIVVEVETGYVPQEWLLRPEEFMMYRLAYKATAYSGDADIFIPAFPGHYRIPVPEPLLKPVEERSERDVALIKGMLMRYNKGQLARIGWRAHLARIDAVAFIDIGRSDVEIVPLNERNKGLKLLL